MSQLALSSINSGHVDDLSSSRKEPDWLREFRRNSLSIYDEMPVETSPLYNKYTDAKRMNQEQVSLSTAGGGSLPSFIEARVAELGNSPGIVQVGSGIHRINLPDDKLVISSIGDALLNGGPARALVESADPHEDKFTALNNAAFDSGIYIEIPDGYDKEEPIHILTCLPEDRLSTISRNVIKVGRDSRSTIVQELYSPPGQGQQAYLEVLTTDIGPGARLSATTLQMMDQASVNFSTRRSDVAQDATINWYLGLFGTVLSRYRIDYKLMGTGASANDSEVVFGTGDQSFDIQSNLNHEAGSTEGRVIEKSILRERSKSLFKGMIRIMEGAAKSNSYLSGRSILLDPDAKSDAIPGLEILTNDVKATHAASVAQIDEEQIFYLQTRCLTEAEAERTIVEGFLEPLSRKMSYQVRAWIAQLVESKWEGKNLAINTDEELRKFIEVEETRYNEDEEIEQHYKYR
ncbi:Fe-S cluster assembly protein [Cenarchaeum symbiosum A]|uniref:Fe-S cluster assembly protein n=1 Tax=Cenarchaeum symbiosum (strain A) TaxID=414004 RepID=A0RXA8_CENSY|nr:Fe-S cluster assembly protein [Cenarchaeum symbiosum A]